MGMGYIPITIINLEFEQVDKLNLTSYREFRETLTKNNVELDTYASIHANAISICDDLLDDLDIDREAFESIRRAHTHFEKDFAKQFGISIDLGYHDQYENGSRYDDIDGAYLSLDFDDVFQMTDQAKQLAQKVSINQLSFAVFG